MTFEPGRQKTGGRKKGVTNRSSANATVRALIEESLGKSAPERLLELAREMGDPRDEADILKSLLPYAYPRLSSSQVTEVPPGANPAVTDKATAELNQLTEMFKSVLEEAQKGKRNV